jgi:hypothetical protein
MADPLVEAYADCLKALEAGVALEAALARHPAWQAELRPLLRLALTIRAMGETASTPRPVEVADRAQWLARAAQQLRPNGRAARRVPVWRNALAVLALTLMIASYGVVTASAQSLPGDALYGVKRSVERVQLWLASDSRDRAELEAEFEGRRRDEVQALIQQKRTASIEFNGRIESVTDEAWLVSGVRVVRVASTQVNGTPLVGASASVHGVLQSDGAVLAEEIEIEDEEEQEIEATPSTGPEPTLANTTPAATHTRPAQINTPTHTAIPVSPTPMPAPTHTPLLAPATQTLTPTHTQGEEMEFTGLIEAMTGNVWRINGVDVQITATTDVHGAAAAIGKRAHVHAWRMPDGSLVAREVEVDDEPDGSLTPEHEETHEAETPEPTETRRPTRTPTP